MATELVACLRRGKWDEVETDNSDDTEGRYMYRKIKNTPAVIIRRLLMLMKIIVLRRDFTTHQLSLDSRLLTNF